MTETYYLEEIISDRDFDFTETFNREPTQRPNGNIVLVILLQPSFGRPYKVYIIKNNNSYFLVAQLKVTLYGDHRIQQSKKVIEHYKDSLRKPVNHTLDLNNPFYNIEWHFEITESFYDTIFESLSKIRIPLKPSSMGMDSTSREIFINTACKIHIEWCEHKDHHWNELTNFTDDLFSFALTKFNTAYMRKND